MQSEILNGGIPAELGGGVLTVHGGQDCVRAGLHGHVQVGEHTGVI